MGNQLSATLKRLEVRPADACDACIMNGAAVQKHGGQQYFAGALPHGHAWKLADEDKFVGPEGRKRSSRAGLECC